MEDRGSFAHLGEKVSRKDAKKMEKVLAALREI